MQCWMWDLTAEFLHILDTQRWIIGRSKMFVPLLGTPLLPRATSRALPLHTQQRQSLRCKACLCAAQACLGKWNSVDIDMRHPLIAYKDPQIVRATIFNVTSDVVILTPFTENFGANKQGSQGDRQDPRHLQPWRKCGSQG